MRYLYLAAICAVLGVWAIETHFDEWRYERECRAAQKERVRKMGLGGQVISEHDFES